MKEAIQVVYPGCTGVVACGRGAYIERDGGKTFQVVCLGLSLGLDAMTWDMGCRIAEACHQSLARDFSLHGVHCCLLEDIIWGTHYLVFHINDTTPELPSFSVLY